jgi:hypothetical protein
MAQEDECRCHCHYTDGRHADDCCEPCKSCDLRIKKDRIAGHFARCRRDNWEDEGGPSVAEYAF